MDEAWQQRVRGRAYAMWQREGNSDGAPTVLADGRRGTAGPRAGTLAFPRQPSRPISRPTRYRLPTIQSSHGASALGEAWRAMRVSQAAEDQVKLWNSAHLRPLTRPMSSHITAAHSQ